MIIWRELFKLKGCSLIEKIQTISPALFTGQMMVRMEQAVIFR
jgi:hypothetical protein